jgi:hypothetical protein
MNEAIVDARMRDTLTSSEGVGRILKKMVRLRNSKGVRDNGGRIDPSREFPKLVRPGSEQIVLPDD